MSTLNEREAVLRRALHAAADAIEPGMDGLERIQLRLSRPRPFALAWAEAAWTDVQLRLLPGWQSALDWLGSAGRLAWDRFGPTPGRAEGRASRTLGWLRPLAALGVTVAIVAVGTYVAISANQSVNLGSSIGRSQGGGGGGGANGGPGGTSAHGHSPFGSGPFGASPSPTCKGKRSRPSASSSPIGSITPVSPSPSTSTSTSGSPSPSASGSPSSNPSASTTAPTGNSTSGLIVGSSASVSVPPGSAGTGHSARRHAAPRASRSPAGTTSPNPCGSPHPKTSRNAVVGATPNANGHAAAVSYGKLNERS
jgi:hypothetical protein